MYELPRGTLPKSSQCLGGRSCVHYLSRKAYYDSRDNSYYSGNAYESPNLSTTLCGIKDGTGHVSYDKVNCEACLQAWESVEGGIVRKVHTSKWRPNVDDALQLPRVQEFVDNILKDYPKDVGCIIWGDTPNGLATWKREFEFTQYNYLVLEKPKGFATGVIYVKRPYDFGNMHNVSTFFFPSWYLAYSAKHLEYFQSLFRITPDILVTAVLCNEPAEIRTVREMIEGMYFSRDVSPLKKPDMLKIVQEIEKYS